MTAVCTLTGFEMQVFVYDITAAYISLVLFINMFIAFVLTVSLLIDSSSTQKTLSALFLVNFWMLIWVGQRAKTTLCSMQMMAASWAGTSYGCKRQWRRSYACFRGLSWRRTWGRWRRCYSPPDSSGRSKLRRRTNIGWRDRVTYSGRGRVHG